MLPCWIKAFIYIKKGLLTPNFYVNERMKIGHNYLLARYVYTCKEFVIVTEAATGQDTDNKRMIDK